MNWVMEAREYIEVTLAKFPKSLTDAAKETAVELLSAELEKIPVPVVGTILSNAVKKTLKSKETGGPSIENVLQQLHYMQRSDEAFYHEITSFYEDVERLNWLVEEVMRMVAQAKKELTLPNLKIHDPKYKLKYPMFDNELNFCLVNLGGGTVVVPEIFLIVDKWEPETTVDYTAPAAPPVFLRLKVRLSPGTSSYPLLQLNNEDFRRYYPQGSGAEDLCVQMSSEKNARYHVRIRIPYKDMATDEVKELIYPSLDEPPIAVSFPYAPGWVRHVTPDNMLERGAVLGEIIDTFGKAKVILEETAPSADATHYEIITERLRDIGFYMGLRYMPRVLNNFIPPVAKMIETENQPGALKVIFALVHQTMRYLHGFSEFENHSIDALCNLVGKEDSVKRIREFFKEQNEPVRQKILTEIFAAI